MTTYTFDDLTRMVKLKQIVDPKGKDTKTLEDTLIYIKELMLVFREMRKNYPWYISSML